jgi:hypothetical protein
MPDDRVFSDEELRLAGLRTLDAIAEAVASGDGDAARRLARRLRREVLSMKANYDAWEAKLLAWVRRCDGDARVAEAAAWIADAPQPPDGSATDDPAPRWRAWAARIHDALADGRDEEAMAIARDLHDDALRVHDRGMARVAGLLSWIGRRYGTEPLEEAYGEAMAADLLGDAGFRERAEALMHFTRVHLQPFEIHEDAEKLTFLCAVCPSGGRLLREGLDGPPRGGFQVQGPRWLTWGRKELPVYCCHEPIMERASILKTGAPLFIVEPSESLGEEPCRTFLYKDPADIPERYYTRLGLVKPKC